MTDFELSVAIFLFWVFAVGVGWLAGYAHAESNYRKRGGYD